MKDIYYENSAGIRLNLLAPPYLLQTGEIFDTNWNYDYINLGSGGSRITTFRKDLEERSLTLRLLLIGSMILRNMMYYTVALEGYMLGTCI